MLNAYGLPILKIFVLLECPLELFMKLHTSIFRMKTNPPLFLGYAFEKYGDYMVILKL